MRSKRSARIAAAELAALEDDIRSDLAAIGITVSTETLEKDPFNAAMSKSTDVCSHLARL